MTQRPRSSRPAATPEERPAGTRGYDTLPTQTGGPDGTTRRGRDPAWPWPRTLRFALLASGAFWLVVGLAVWAFLRAG